MLRKRWRVLRYEKGNAAYNMALDEAIAEAVAFRVAGPTMRFYGWEPAAVSIGRFQKLDEVVDMQECERLGVEVVRRSTGGGAVFHDQEITYSVICPEDMMPADINSAYQEIGGWIVNALKLIGIEGTFEPINDVLVKGRKISGSAQSRRKGIFVQHGTLIYDLDRAKMFSVLKVPKDKLESQSIGDPAERVTSVREQRKVPWEYMAAAMANAFIMNREWYSGDITTDELTRAEVIAKLRYANRDWTFER
ncbi:MAG TPA: biotin/lipoate A/B protein ligase family protein [Methanomassiliicoccales archaeon]|jgi:lipoate-protein ligase A|nr:biotin/lipoate A/B protein ligase family protein [Methanomassiliicoccales archaeon]